MKPVVKLLINRHNNKYSYTGASDDNLLKNIELFDKLSLRFSNRVLFIKDVIGSNEICCWSFYGHGKKIAEVCCFVHTTFSHPYFFCSGLLYSHSLCHRPEEHQGRVSRGSDLRGDAQLPSLRKQDRTRPRLDAGARLFQSSSANH